MPGAHADSHSPPKEKWKAAEVAEHYAGRRFANDRAAGRDFELVERLLDRFEEPGDSLRCLDLPTGTGRLAAGLVERGYQVIGADISSAMLARATQVDPLVASAERLPFRSDSFDLVLCCRLLHHLSGEEVSTVLGELVRVARGLVLASFWDAASWPAWRRRRGYRIDDSGRRAIAKKELESHLAAAGARPLGYAHSFRFLSQQTFVAARKKRV